ncbi:MAG TPA: PilZ domain-containing protein [Phycisphaerae bacterium]|nr:PilZ domain-containing protein [Phycisphaerae bacterium]
MATLQPLSNRQIDEVIRAASQRHVPVTLTVRVDGTWVTSRGHIADLRGGHLLLELAEPDGDEPGYGFQPADSVGVSFKLKHHKHIFTGTVAGVQKIRCADGTEVQMVQVCSPTRMLRMQRRVFLRVPVPANRVVRASYWLGSCDDEPTSGRQDQPVRSGRLVDISAGGFQLISTDGGTDALDIGETVGTRISFGVGDETVYADAQFRHRKEVDGQVHLGFQFVGLAQTSQGRKALQLMGDKAAQFQRETNATQRAGR